jgi:hypothetical protein
MYNDDVLLTVGPSRVVISLNGPGKKFYGAMFEFCKKLTTFEYNHRFKRYVKDREYYIYDKDTKSFIIPIQYLTQIKDMFASKWVTPKVIDAESYRARCIAGVINPDFAIRDYQAEAITYINDGKGGRKGLSLQTGKGKTFTAVAAALDRGLATLIIASGLTTQWIKAIHEQTLIVHNLGIGDEYEELLMDYGVMKRKDGEKSAKPKKLGDFIKRSNAMVGSDIYIVQGFESLMQLFDSGMRPKFIFASLETLRAYAKGGGNYEDLPTYSDFLKFYGIGTRITDESHLNFHTNVMLDLYGNVPLNLYLTATFDTANKGLEKIFNMIYPESMRHGSDKYDKYVNSFFYGYYGNIPEKICVKGRGYSHNDFEAHMLKHQNIRIDWYNRVLIPIVNSHYLNSDHSKLKLLIFCKSIAFCDDVVDMLRSHISDKNILTYLGRDPESHLTDADIIVSTHGSAGTGCDIKDLYCVINTVSFKASTTVRQVLGRLRELKGGITPEYVDLLDLNLSSHKRHWRERSQILKQCSVVYKEYQIS